MKKRTLISGLIFVTSFIGMGMANKVLGEGVVADSVVTSTAFPTDEEIVTASYDFNQQGSDVRRLQQVLGIKKDGIYGAQTWASHRAYLIAHQYSTKYLPVVPQAFTDEWYPVKYKSTTVYLPLDKSKRCINYEDELRAYKLPVDIFSYVAWRESKCNPKAVGWNYRTGMSRLDCKNRSFDIYLHTCKALSSFDSGLLQVNSSWYSATKTICRGTPQEGALFSLDCNLKVSRYIITHTSRPMSNWGFYSRKVHKV